METLLHNIDIILSSLAFVFSTIALVVSLRKKGSPAQDRDADYVAPTPGAQLCVNMVKMPSDLEHGHLAQDFRFWISNIGTGPARNVFFEVDMSEEMLFQQECDEKLPAAIMNPGDRIELCSRVGVTSPKVIRTLVYWEDASGVQTSQEFLVSKEVDDSY